MPPLCVSWAVALRSWAFFILVCENARINPAHTQERAGRAGRL